MYYNLAEEEFARVRPDQVQRYLESMGWTNVGVVPGKFFVYGLPANRSAEVAVPMSTTFHDYTRRVAEVVHDVAEFQARSMQSVLDGILFLLMDHLMFHLEGPAVSGHRIGLEEGVNVYQGALSVLNAAAHDQIEPKPFHPRLGRVEAERYVRACQMGAATPGSYIANVFCPADLAAIEQPAPSLPDLDRNFARAVTARTLRSIARSVQAIRKDDLDSLVHPRDEAETTSSNFFEALSSIKLNNPQTEMTISVEWTPKITPPADVPHSLVLHAEDFAIFGTVADRLRPAKLPKTEQITGRIAVLSGKKGDASSMQGEVIIEGETADKQIVRVRVDLDDKDYERACDAHKQNRQVRIAGELQFGKRLHQLNKYFGFSVGDVKSKFDKEVVPAIEVSSD